MSSPKDADSLEDEPMARTMLLHAVAGLAFGLAASAPLPLAAAGQGPVGTAGNADNGKRLYMKETCYFCHGSAGQGSVAGPRLAVIARNTEGFIC